MEISEFQDLMRRIYFKRDKKRGVERTFIWLTEEIGELASAINKAAPKEYRHEFCDVLAWVCSLANMLDIDLARELRKKYGKGCPKCKKTPCGCRVR